MTEITAIHVQQYVCNFIEIYDNIFLAYLKFRLSK